MAKINHTFSTDSTAEFRGQPLAGVACIGGLVELDHGKRLVVQFEGPAIGPAPRRSVPVEIRADADPELFGAVKDHVLGEFRVSPHHGISRQDDGWLHVHSGPGEYLVSEARAAMGYGRDYTANLLGEVGGLKGGPVARESYAAFAIIDHPKYGLMGVTEVEFAALGLQELAI